MASTWYPKGLQHVLQGDITGGFDAATLKACLMPTSAGYDETDEVIGDVGTPAATSAALTTVAISVVAATPDWVKFSADNLTWTSVPAGAECNRVVVYWDSGSGPTSYVLVSDDLAVPVTPNGNNINLTWGADGVAKVTPAS